MGKIAQLMARLGRWIFETHDARRMSRQQLDSSDLQVHADIPYIADGTPEHLLDIYRLKTAPASQPVIVNIHGGGLFASYKSVNTAFNYEWARLGYAVVSLSYRRLPDTTLIHQIEDVMAALRFIRANSERYDLNIDRCYLTGDSAGALLGLFALLINQSPDLQQAFSLVPSGITFRAAACISIMLDTRRRDLLWFLSRVVTTPDETEEPYLKYIIDPAAMISLTKLPPMYMVTSAEDLIRRDTLRFDQLLTAAGVEHQLMDLPRGKQHKLEHVFSVQYPLWDESRQVLAAIDRFFRQHGG